MIGTIIFILWIILQCIIAFHLLFPMVLYWFYRIFRKKYPDSSTVIPGPELDYGIIVTAYEQTHTLPAVVESLLKLNYSNYMVYVVADKCDISNLHFDSPKVVLLRPEETIASNTGSHFYAIDRFVRPHPYLTIIDSDNLVDPEYLTQLNTWFNRGFKAVQGVREAKNLDTDYSRLDAARDIYYHFYDGKILFEAGSSATLAGSGMAFTTELYRKCLEHLDIKGAGFDKILQAAIVNGNDRIAFTMDAIVYDEKTSRSDQLVSQRSRWINTWFKYFGFGFVTLVKSVLNFSLNQFLFGWVLVRPPLFIFLILSVLFSFINLLMGNFLVALLWVAGLCIFIRGFALALSVSNADKAIYKSLVNIPKFMFLQVLSLLKIFSAHKNNVATKRYVEPGADEQTQQYEN